MLGSDKSKEETVHSVSFRSFAFATILVRDIFGYLFIGIGFWAFLFWLGNLPFTSTAAPSDVQLAGLAIVLGYPAGRFLFYVGTGLSNMFPCLRWESLMFAAFEELSKTAQIEASGFEPFGIPFKPQNARLLCGSLIGRKIFSKNPPFYFLYMARTNTLRLMNETTLGLIVVGSGFYLAHGTNAYDWRKWLASVAWCLRVRTRLRAHARSRQEPRC